MAWKSTAFVVKPYSMQELGSLVSRGIWTCKLSESKQVDNDANVPKDFSTSSDISSLSSQQSHEYSFYDEATIQVRAGSGGQGSSTYKKAVKNQNGPPDGGNGGRGGNVYLVVDDSLNTLAGLNPAAWRPNSFGGSGAARSSGARSSSGTTMFKCFRADNGIDGGRGFKDGRSGKDVMIRVPPGTLVQEVHILEDEEGNEKEVLKELGSIVSEEKQNECDEPSSLYSSSVSPSTLLVARGGEGGEGSGINYKQRGVHRPRTPPQSGEKKLLRLTLKLVADVAIVAVPNAGKSTFLSSVTRAKPRIADYPFTTVIPNLGVWAPPELFSEKEGDTLLGSGGEGLILCDVPGLIEGASQGVGLGHAFLRHVERCHVILHLVDATAEDPIQDFAMLNKELVKYGTGQLAQMPQVVVVNKLDALDANPQNCKYSQEELEERLKAAMSHSRLMWMSAKEGDNVDEVMHRLAAFVKKVVTTAA
jgi:GTP-binding protein